MKAKDLLKIDGRSWDRYLLDGLPAPYDVSRILQVPVALVGALADCRIWHYSSDGQYSVKSACALAFNRRARNARLLQSGIWASLSLVVNLRIWTMFSSAVRVLYTIGMAAGWIHCSVCYCS
ncbi:hypothetical protein GOBAR_AA02066 [Gossypium barbadense]|uniref:Uncharacterized protein n=1 Tax=Gossypium barbadense TaxID=3634 RepID=A0A2P5YSG7_GOSBA|nr:hypothetical protein GOBAR_AA02066 [Gossypium barbadense]